MEPQDPSETIPLERRKEIFQALVEVQDQGMSVERSRQTINKRFETTDRQLKSIEREGLDNGWPPINS